MLKYDLAFSIPTASCLLSQDIAEVRDSAGLMRMPREIAATHFTQLLDWHLFHDSVVDQSEVNLHFHAGMQIFLPQNYTAAQAVLVSLIPGKVFNTVHSLAAFSFTL